MREDKSLLISYLEQQKMDDSLIHDVVEFREKYETAEEVRERVYIPDMLFYGKDILEMSAAALLQGENLLLSGAKATGKNVLCETLAWIFGRPSYDISFHVNTDSASLIGTDTFINNEVRLRKGPVYRNHELRICRNERAERSSGIPVYGSGYAAAFGRDHSLSAQKTVCRCKGAGT